MVELNYLIRIYIYNGSIKKTDQFDRLTTPLYIDNTQPYAVKHLEH